MWENGADKFIGHHRNWVPVLEEGGGRVVDTRDLEATEALSEDDIKNHAAVLERFGARA